MLVSNVNISKSIKYLCTIERDLMTTRILQKCTNG